jgi:hypothetical protein
MDREMSKGREQRTSSNSGTPSSRSRRPSRASQPMLPGWGPAFSPTLWWEAVPPRPCASQPGPLDAAETGSTPTRPTADEPLIENLLPGGQARKGVSTMVRVFAILAALAALFLVAGASAKY